MKKEWFSFIVEDASCLEDKEVLEMLNKLSNDGVSDESIKIAYDESTCDVVIFYRHTHRVH